MQLSHFLGYHPDHFFNSMHWPEEASPKVHKSLKSSKSVDMIRGHSRLVTFGTAVLFKWPAEVGQDPQRQQIDAEERLDPGHCPDPSGGAQGILAGLQAGNPGPDVQLSPA